MAGKARIGFVGAGFMGQKAHLDTFCTIPECEIVALAEGRTETAELVARKYGIPKVYPDHRAMLEAEDLDAVVAIMHYGLHHCVVPDILEAGKHLLTEKPMCIQAETGTRLAELAERKGVVYFVGYMKRSAPATQLAIENIRAWQALGPLGEMRYLRAVMPPGNWTYDIEPPLDAGDAPPAYEGVEPEPLPKWMDETTARAYNGFVNYYIHQVNMIRYLLGEDYHVTWVDPTSAVLGGMSDSGVPLILEMQGYGLRNGWEESYRVIFEEGKIELDIPSPLARQRGGEVRMFRGKDMQREDRLIVPPHWPFLEQARHFVRCVRGEDTPRVSPRDAVKDLEVAEEYARRLAMSDE